MRKLAAWMGIMLTATTCIAVNNPNAKPSFADSTWYSDRNTVKKQMSIKGYRFERDKASDGSIDSIFSGKLLGIPVVVQHWFNNKNQLVRTSIVFEKSYSASVYSNFSTMKSSLSAKYGAAIDITNIDKSFSSDDIGLKIELDGGKKLSSAWFFPTYGYSVYLGAVQAYVNDDDYYLVLSYESPAWKAESSRRDQNNDL